ALALVLLAGAGVLTKNLIRVAAPETGTDGLDLLRGDLEFLDARYQDPSLIRSAVHDVVSRLEHAPGVTNASLHGYQFIAGFGASDRTIRAEGVDSGAVRAASPRFAFVVTPSYFSTLRLPVSSGRAFDAQDRPGSLRTVMINKHMAEVFWPGQSPLGRRIKLGVADSLPWLTVVGTVGDIVAHDTVTNYAYLPLDQATIDRLTVLVRSPGDPTTLVPAVRAAVRAVDQDLPVRALQTVRQARRDSFWPYQMYSMTIGIFAAFALLLAAVGLYGVIAYNTAMRTREIGVRIALGAEGRQVTRMVAKEGGKLIAMGIVLGLGGSIVLVRAVRLMFGASTIDIPVFAGVSALLATVALAAIWAPARRAARISPLEALRAE
ncbi:MAG: FtsX-like permease family protein, partial [bacterium]